MTTKLQQAIQLSQSGEHQQAFEIFKRLEKTNKKDPWLKIYMANCLIYLNHTEEAEKCLDSSLNSPDLSPEILSVLKNLYLNIFCFKKAINAANQWVNAEPNNIKALAELVQTAYQARDYSLALSTCNQALEIFPKDPWLLAFKGRILSGEGRFSQAESYFSEAIQLAPNYSYPYSGLVKAKKFENQDRSQISQFDNGLKVTENPSDKARILFAKAKVLNDLNEYDEAWEAATLANKTLQQIQKFDKAVYKDFIGNLKTSYSSPSTISYSDNKAQNILIVGMPRSGTTLIEQIITSDTSIYSGGETPAIDDALHRVFDGQYLSRSPKANSDQLNKVAYWYNKHFESFANFYGSRILDKVPSNYLLIGPLLQAFPNLKIINLKRNALDVATSIYFENFSSMLSYGCDFKNTLFVQKQYQEIMQFWHQTFPSRILDIEYEDFVTQYNDHLGIICDFVEAIKPRNFEQVIASKNNVITPSLWQVRQGINSKSIERWKRYQKFIQPLIDEV